MKTADVIRYVENLAGHPLNPDEGVQHGDANREMTGATVSWMASPDAVHAAGRSEHEVLIVHESLYFPYNVAASADAPPDWHSWKINRRRRELLDRYGLTCVRIHGTADEICVFDAFADLLGLGEPVSAEGFVKVYEIPECSLDELVQKVKARTGMAALRVARGEEGSRSVKRVGLPWGGMGLFVNVSYQQCLVEQGCDVFIAGESDNYGFRFAVESGIPMIETSHEVSENPGLRRFTQLLAEAFPSMEFCFHQNQRIWRVE